MRAMCAGKHSHLYLALHGMLQQHNVTCGDIRALFNTRREKSVKKVLQYSCLYLHATNIFVESTNYTIADELSFSKNGIVLIQSYNVNASAQ